MITKAQRRAHLEAVYLSAKLRGKNMDCAYARAALGLSPNTHVLSERVHALRSSLIVETPSGDRPEDERRARRLPEHRPMNRATRRAHLEAVILSAGLRGRPMDSEWARAVLDTRNRIGIRVDILRALLAVETPSGNVDKNLMRVWAHWLVDQK